MTSNFFEKEESVKQEKTPVFMNNFFMNIFPDNYDASYRNKKYGGGGKRQKAF